MEDVNEVYQEQTQQEQGDGAPNPADYEDYDEYVKAQIDHAIKMAVPKGDPAQPQVTAEAVAQGVAQALQPQISVMDKLNAEIDAKKPDDELFGPRTNAADWIEHCKTMETKAKLNGDEKKARDWRQRAKWGVDEIERLGKSEAEKYAEMVHEEVDFRSIDQLFDKTKVDEKYWDTSKMQHDASIVINRHNQKNRHGLIALPLEASPWGEILPVHPKNMSQIQLPAQVFQTFKNLVYHSGKDNTPAAIFKRSWAVLRQLGYAETAKPAVEAKTKQTSDEPETDPNRMTFKEFEEWRMKSEKKREPFVFPKKRHG